LDKEAKRIYDRKRYLERREEICQSSKEYKIAHPEVNRKAQRVYYWKNKESILSKKHLVDVSESGRRKGREYYYKNRISKSMATAIRLSLKKGKDGITWRKLVPYSCEELKSHLESQFRDGMNWDNYGLWHIDHVKPISSFDITSYMCNDFKQCWSLENLQPLWAYENLRKGNKWQD
jgi:hypothetical protein